MMVVEESFLVDTGVHSLVNLAHEFLELLLALLQLLAHSLLLDNHLLPVEGELTHELTAVRTLLLAHYIQFK